MRSGTVGFITPDLIMIVIRHIYACLGLLALPISGCISPRAQTEVVLCDPAFTKGTLAGTRLALAEIVSLPGVDYFPNNVQKELILKDLARQLAESKQEINVMGTDSAQTTIVALPHETDWLRSGVLKVPLKTVERTRLEKAGCCYLIVLVLQTNSIDERVDRFYETTTDVDTDDEGKEISRTEITTYYTNAVNCRKIRACYYLFDLKTGFNLWRANGWFSRCSISSESSGSGYPEAPFFKQAPGESEVLKYISKAVLKKLL